MNKLFWQTLKVAPILITASLFAANGASAQSINANQEAVNNTLQQINNYQKQEPNDSLSQVTNVNQLRDVSPTDWAYEALRSLVDRYGCISGFPNQTYRGNQALTRYEFAAGLNSCLNQIERLIASAEAVAAEDLETINRLQQEFEAELATLGGRVDELESRTAFLEDNQFSTTTKLKGEAIFSLSNAYGGGIEGVSNSDTDAQATLSNRVRLNFDTSFFGNDRLRTRLSAGNITRYDSDVTGTDSSRLGYDLNNGNSVEIEDLHYRFSATDRFRIWVGTTGLNFDDILNVGNPVLASSGSGALSRFSRRDPAIYRGTDGSGAGFNWEIVEDKLDLNALYVAGGGSSGSASPSAGEGIFNGSFSASGQLAWRPIESLELIGTYVRNYQTDGDVNQAGSTVGRFDAADNLVQGFAREPFPGIATAADKGGLGVNFNLGEKVVIAGWGSYSSVKGLVSGNNNDPSGNIWTWSANVSFVDLGREGAQLSFAGGMLPKFTSDIGANEINAGVQEDPNTSYIVEGLYKFPVNDNIAITPGAYVVFNPNHVDTNENVYVGVIRTTFTF